MLILITKSFRETVQRKFDIIHTKKWEIFPTKQIVLILEMFRCSPIPMKLHVNSSGILEGNKRYLSCISILHHCYFQKSIKSHCVFSSLPFIGPQAFNTFFDFRDNTSQNIKIQIYRNKLRFSENKLVKGFSEYFLVVKRCKNDTFFTDNWNVFVANFKNSCSQI